jgi:hypothetical protein
MHVWEIIVANRGPLLAILFGVAVVGLIMLSRYKETGHI